MPVINPSLTKYPELWRDLHFYSDIVDSPNEDGSVDLVTGLPLDFSVAAGYNPTALRYGPGLTNSDYIGIPTNGVFSSFSLPNLPIDMTIIMFGGSYSLNGAVTDFSRELYIRASGNEADNFIRFSRGWDSVNVSYRAGSTSFGINSNNTIPTTSKYYNSTDLAPVAWVLDGTANTGTVHFPGITNSVSYTSQPGTSSPIDDIYFFNNTGTSFDLSEFYYAAIWLRKLSADEINLFFEDPWVLIRPNPLALLQVPQTILAGVRTPRSGKPVPPPRWW